MDKIKGVAELLGVEIGEEFIAKYPKWKQVRCKFRENCFDTSATDGKLWGTDTSVLYDLIRGNCKVYKLPWKAKKNENYFIPAPSHCDLYFSIDSRGISRNRDTEFYEKGLMCKTKEQAIKTAKAMIEVAREMQGFEDENL